MKVLHITYTDTGGAGIAAVRIHKALINLGIDSSMLVAEKTTNESTIYSADECVVKDHNTPKSKLLRKVMKLLRKLGYFLTEKERYERMVRHVPHKYQTMFTSPLSCYNLLNHPKVKEADIIHLHWIANYVDYPSFFPNINKPIVWTLHDENLAYGGFHYGRERDQHYKYYSKIEDAYCQIKQSSLEQCANINVVALSKMMQEYYSTKSILSNRNIDIIHNGIDTTTFQPIDKCIGRKVLNIPDKNIVIVFCCVNLNDKRKGLSLLVEAIENLNIPNITLICIGSGHVEEETSVDIRYTGPISNPNILAMIYSCGDLFAFPSYQEAFAQTPLEAIACGLPIVAFPCSGMAELITSQNGVVCDDFTSESLLKGIREILSHKYDRQTLHENIVKRFHIEKIASDYLKLYNKVIANT